MTLGGHTQPTALTNVNTVLVSHTSAGVWLYQGFLTFARNFSSLGMFCTPVLSPDQIWLSNFFFFTFLAEEVSNGENKDGDDMDLHDIFDDPAVEEQLWQNDLEQEHELDQQGGTTLIVTVDVHAPVSPVTPKTEHVDVVSKDKYPLQ